MSKYLNKVGWKTRRGNKFYGSNLWTFEKMRDKWRQVIESQISDMKIEFENIGGRL